MSNPEEPQFMAVDSDGDGFRKTVEQAQATLPGFKRALENLAEGTFACVKFFIPESPNSEEGAYFWLSNPLQLVEMLNELYESMRQLKDEGVLGKILNDMAEYAQKHFATEEAYMNKYNFPGFAEHKQEHEAFVAKSVDLLKQFKNDPNMLSIETGRYLKQRLKQHIMGTDKLYGPFLNEKGVY